MNNSDIKITIGLSWQKEIAYFVQLKTHTLSMLQRGDDANCGDEIWTEVEDEHLTDLIRLHGENWNIIALGMGGNRPLGSLQSRWHHILTTTYDKRPFTPDEDATILAAVEIIGPKFSKIANLLSKKTEALVHKRYKELVEAMPAVETAPRQQLDQGGPPGHATRNYLNPSSSENGHGGMYVPSDAETDACDDGYFGGYEITAFPAYDTLVESTYSSTIASETREPLQSMHHSRLHLHPRRHRQSLLPPTATANTANSNNTLAVTTTSNSKAIAPQTKTAAQGRKRNASQLDLEKPRVCYCKPTLHLVLYDLCHVFLLPFSLIHARMYTYIHASIHICMEFVIIFLLKKTPTCK
jgi:hypothetical protein